MAMRRLPPARPPLVGRDAEIETVQAALDQVHSGHGRLLLVSGEPGIGKTRLVEELAALAAEQGSLVAWGRADDTDGAPPYRPWVQLLDSVLDGADRDVVAAGLDAHAGPLAAILPRLGERAGDFPTPPALDPVAARFRLHDAVTDLLARASAHRSLVLVLDDLHWADPASLELTRFAAARLTAAPVLLVVTYRSVDADRGDGGGSEAFGDLLGSLARIPRLTRVPLHGLTPAEVGRFMDQTIGLRSRPAAVATVHARTEGNPFFVGELARLLHSEGLLAAAGTPGRAPGMPAGVPVGVRDVVRRRLLRLPSTTGRLLGLGAVLGREFDLAVLAGAADLDPGAVVDGLEPALAAGLVQEEGSAPATLRFSHALIRDTVYDELGALRRATLHARVGETIDRRHTGPDRSHVAELAWHYFHAASVVGPEPGLSHVLEAAGAAAAALAYEQAEDDLRRALGLVDHMPAGPARHERELHVQNRIAGLLLMTKGQGAAAYGEACTRARELCTVIGASDDLFGTLFGLSLYHATHCEYTLLAELGAQLLAVGRQHGNTAWLLAGHLSVGCSALHTGSLSDALDDFETAVRLARDLAGSAALTALFVEHPLPVSLQTCALAAWLRGDDVRAWAMSDESVRLATDLADPLTRADALYAQNKLAVLTGDPERVLREAEPALALCEEHGLGMFHAWIRAHRGWALCHHGRGEEGLREIEAGLVANQAGGGQMNTPLLLGLLADGEALRGDHERALAAVDDALALTGASEGRLYEADLHRRRGELLATRGADHAEEAVAALRTAVAIAETRGAVPFLRRAELALAALAPVRAPVPAGSLPAGSPSLSPRELVLLALVGQGRTDKQIAAELVISLATVRSHLDRIRDKTGRRRRAELTRLAVDLGVIPP